MSVTEDDFDPCYEYVPFMNHVVVRPHFGDGPETHVTVIADGYKYTGGVGPQKRVTIVSSIYPHTAQEIIDRLTEWLAKDDEQQLMTGI